MIFKKKEPGFGDPGRKTASDRLENKHCTLKTEQNTLQNRLI